MAKLRKTSHGAAPETVRGDSYTSLVQAVELQSVRMVNCASGVHFEHLADGANVDANMAVTRYRATIDTEHRVLYCGVQFKMTLGAAEAEPAASVDAEYALVYSLAGKESFDEKDGRLFASRNAVFNAWPFFRELVQSHVCRMGLPPLVAPLMKLPPLAPAPQPGQPKPQKPR